MIKYQVHMSDSNGNLLEGREREERVKKIQKVHDTLYKFSIQKAMTLLKNPYYMNLFKIYYHALRNDEIEMSNTMQKNRVAYLSAFRSLINGETV